MVGILIPNVSEKSSGPHIPVDPLRLNIDRCIIPRAQ